MEVKEGVGAAEETNHMFGSPEQIGSVAAKLRVGLRWARGGKPDTHPTCWVDTWALVP